MAFKVRTMSEKLSSVQLIVLFYFLAVMVSTVLLLLPAARNPGVELSIVDALFTAASAVSVTGLTVVSTAETFSTTGYFILIFIVQFGGIGIMTLGTFVWLIMGKKIGFKERQLIMIDQNRSTFSGLVQLMREILSIIITIEIIGTLVLGTHFLQYYPTWQEAYLHGLFAAVNAATNAGFDITGQSMIPYAHDYFVQAVHMILVILGAIGFPVLVELKEYITYKGKGKSPYRFSLFTKLTTSTFFLLLVIGTFFIYFFDRNHFFSDKTWHETLFYALFQGVSTRSGGLVTMDLNDFSTPTHLVLAALMFIGASPSSVGSGIRTTTFAIVALSIFAYAKGRSTVKVFRKEIHPVDVHRSFIVLTVAVFLCAVSFIMLASTEPSLSLTAIVFEVCSAFGTTGLSLGITPELSTIGKLLLIALMFIGRIGIFSLLFLIRGKEVKENIHYPQERVSIG